MMFAFNFVYHTIIQCIQILNPIISNLICISPLFSVCPRASFRSDVLNPLVSIKTDIFLSNNSCLMTGIPRFPHPASKDDKSIKISKNVLLSCSHNSFLAYKACKSLRKRRLSHSTLLNCKTVINLCLLILP